VLFFLTGGVSFCSGVGSARGSSYGEPKVTPPSPVYTPSDPTSDWQARDAALEHIFRIHGKYVERIDVFDHSRHVQGEPADESMSDEMRQKARELLTMQRQMLQKSLPARFRTYEPDPDRHGHHEERDDATGRYTSSNGHDDEDA
jgi:hypothetical protein